MPQSRPFWTIGKIYWLLYILPLAAWFAMDGFELFYIEPDSRHPERVWFKLFVYLLIVNTITLFVFRSDRRRAERGDWRISENTLVYLVVLGGLPGALLAMRLYSHKTAKWSFQLRVFLWASLEIAFTFVVLPRTYSIANDLRWGITLFSLFWWNLEVAQGILRFLKGQPRRRTLYLLQLTLATGLFLLAALGGTHLVARARDARPDAWDYARVGIIGAGALLVIFNEVTLTRQRMRGKLPGWDPLPPPGA